MKCYNVREKLEKSIANNIPFYITFITGLKFYAESKNNGSTYYLYKVNNDEINNDCTVKWTANKLLTNCDKIRRIELIK